jgi:hypothetical protein
VHFTGQVCAWGGSDLVWVQINVNAAAMAARLIRTVGLVSRLGRGMSQDHRMVFSAAMVTGRLTDSAAFEIGGQPPRNRQRQNGYVPDSPAWI